MLEVFPRHDSIMLNTYVKIKQPVEKLLGAVKEQVLMTATVQNIKRMVKLLSNKGPIREAAAESLLPILILTSLVYKLLALLSQNTKRILYSYEVCLSEVWFLNRLIRFDHYLI